MNDPHIPDVIEPTPAKKGGAIHFLARLVSSIVLWVIVLAGVFYAPPIVFYAILTGIACLALWEFYNVVDSAGLRCYRNWGMAGCVALMMGSWFFFDKGVLTPNATYFSQVVMIVFILGVFIRQFPQKHNPQTLETMACTIFGLLYVPWLLSFIAFINFSFLTPEIPAEAARSTQQDGRFFVLYLLLVTKFTDVGAYIFGTTMGRHKLIPRISPKKTWEGVAGGILFAVLASCLGFHFMNTLAQYGMNWTHSIILGVLLGVAAIIGDLAESLVKRQADIKDSGNMLPGIGGALDLVDSLLFTAPILYVYMQMVL